MPNIGDRYLHTNLPEGKIGVVVELIDEFRVRLYWGEKKWTRRPEQISQSANCLIVNLKPAPEVVELFWVDATGQKHPVRREFLDYLLSVVSPDPQKVDDILAGMGLEGNDTNRRSLRAARNYAVQVKKISIVYSDGKEGGYFISTDPQDWDNMEQHRLRAIAGIQRAIDEERAIRKSLFEEEK